MSTITKDQEAAIAAKISDMNITAGLGDEESACTIAAINLALTGGLTDEIPACMSNVLGKFVVRVQDALPRELRNSPEYRRLIPFMAGTGRTQEKERLTIVLSWVWEVVLPTLQPIADAQGFGDLWETMLKKRSPAAANAAAEAAAEAAYAATAANAAYAAAYAADAADAAYAAYAAYAAAYAAFAVVYAAADAADAADFWQSVDLIGLLTRLVFLDEVSK